MATRREAGNFRDLKTRLLLFDEAVHRHDRGWPHGPQEGESENPPKRRWKRVGILHFRHHDEDEPEGSEERGP